VSADRAAVVLAAAVHSVSNKSRWVQQQLPAWLLLLVVAAALVAIAAATSLQ